MHYIVLFGWYVKEQVEEEETANEVLAKIKFVSENKSALYMLDQEFGTRTFVAPTIG